MDCSLLDLVCHAQGALWDAWAGLGLAKQVAVVCGVLLIVGGALWGFLQGVKRIGGWPAVGGVGLLILVGVLSVLPKKPEPKSQPRVSKPDAPAETPKPRVRTALDWFKQMEKRKRRK